MKKYFLTLFLLIHSINFAQNKAESVMSLSEYLGYIKTYHPIVKQANLIINTSEAKLLKARGAFDPKIEVDFDKKKFKSKEYYNKLNATFKIPTYYGLEFKANFENNEGLFLNPEGNVPTKGLYSAGVSASLLKGFLINKRMAALKQAKIFVNQAKEEQQILVNTILYNASLAYFNWLKTYNEQNVYRAFLKNAETRFKGTKQAFLSGEKPAIDTLEARITLNNRKLNLEKARIKLVKSSLDLSNFLWLNNNTPIELQENIIPNIETLNTVDDTFNISLFNSEDFDINEHPKIKSLDYKIQSLNIDKKLKLNNLLPELNVQYNFLTATPRLANSLNTNNYKTGLNFKLPLFLRKERGDFKLADVKLKEFMLENEATKITIKNKVSALQQELISYELQNNYLTSIVKDYNTLVKAEERKFFLGESSLFLVNYRESKLIEVKLKAIDLENLFFKSKANLFKAAVITIN
ncbi:MULTISPECIES: TolC family protein [Tenacibaculum]|uniref:TolC family protein n=1 Tax=Tenacibaculum TaxID=104267 RepID=UPI001F0B640F|nr:MULTISPECIES: TolC family protein [Tenacibaculum]MCH3882101.1 TolC family protein [Tenacibaculum aquimarinum]MCH3885119.1 TolC family protein [Tenacibaculum aquimarinum]MDO6599741.1 TolC family protein [Tenacibaculum sp. 1_MG-2023]